MIRFKPSDLIMPWNQWTLLVGPPLSEFRKQLDPVHLEWLNVWEFNDDNNMFDEVRRFNRYGHFKGWMDCLTAQKEHL